MQVPRCCGVHGMPSTEGNSLGPPPNTAPTCAGAGGTTCGPPDWPLTQTPAKSVGTVPLGHAAAGDAVAHATAPSNRADTTALTSIFMPPSLSAGSGAGATCRLRGLSPRPPPGPGDLFGSFAAAVA